MNARPFAVNNSFTASAEARSRRVCLHGRTVLRQTLLTATNKNCELTFTSTDYRFLFVGSRSWFLSSSFCLSLLSPRFWKQLSVPFYTKPRSCPPFLLLTIWLTHAINANNLHSLTLPSSEPSKPKMTPAPYLAGLGQSPAPVSNALTRPSTAEPEHSTLYQRYELLQQYDKEKNDFIGVGATDCQRGSKLRLTIPGTAYAL